MKFAEKGVAVSELDVYLSEQVLPLFRTRAELYRWRAVQEYGSQAWNGVCLLEEAAERGGTLAVIPYVQKAIASMCRVIMRADDSSGIIGDTIRQLLKLQCSTVRGGPAVTGEVGVVDDPVPVWRWSGLLRH